MEVERNAIELWYWMEISHNRHAPTALPLGKNPPYPMNRSLGGPQGWYGRFGEEKSSCPYPVCSLVAVPTTLSTQIVHILCDVAQFDRHL
jgi:hypothetical protein